VFFFKPPAKHNRAKKGSCHNCVRDVRGECYTGGIRHTAVFPMCKAAKHKLYLSSCFGERLLETAVRQVTQALLRFHAGCYVL